MNNNITFLDCTLRDGGYYNQWDFETPKAEALVTALNKAGVEIIEVGYKSPIQSKFFGLFKYCNEGYLDFLSKDDPSSYAFMIDVKDFLDEGKLAVEALDKVIRPATESVFTWVRLATHFATLEDCPAMIKYFMDKGYRVGFNLMGGSLLSEEQVARGAQVADENGVEVFYVADSFGSFYPEDIRSLVRLIKKNFSRAIGMHTHDNQGMAFANTMTAIEEGVTFVDGTVTGMGRGAGNLMTEQFLLGINEKNESSQYKASALLPIIETYIDPMKKEYKWGYDYSYMLSGLKNIHQTYCQKLIEAKRFTNEEISLILEAIPTANRSKFNQSILEKAVAAQIELEHTEHLDEIESLDLSKFSGESILICARGTEAERHKDDILKFVDQQSIQVIECNDTGFFDRNLSRFLVVLNQLKLKKFVNASKGSNDGVESLITGMPFNAQNLKNVFYFPFKIGSFDPYGKDLIIPDYDVGVYAIALAIRAGFKNVYLAGFDGLEVKEHNVRMDALFNSIKERVEQKGVSISHVTPTQYQSFESKSLYTV